MTIPHLSLVALGLLGWLDPDMKTDGDAQSQTAVPVEIELPTRGPSEVGC